MAPLSWGPLLQMMEEEVAERKEEVADSYSLKELKLYNIIMSSTRIPRSIYGRVKSIQNFDPQICPILVHGDSGAEGKKIAQRIENGFHSFTCGV